MSDSTSLPTLQCPNCRSALQVADSAREVEEKCPVCRGDVWITVFDRFRRRPLRRDAGRLGDESQASCTFYPELAAEKVCDECGCLLSEKAAVRWGDEDLCLPCLHRLREEKKSTRFVARAKLYDNRALILVTLLAPFTLFTAPIALVLLWKQRNQGATFESRGRWRWWTAMILAVAWLAAWVVLGVVWTSLILEDLS